MSWIEQALCAEIDPELFFPDKGGPARDAIKVCKRCPVQEPCLQFAIDNRIIDGIWGGQVPNQRKRKHAPYRDPLHCAAGHPKTAENVGSRGRCLICQREASAASAKRRQRERGYDQAS